ncbi:hypothetical protein A5819_001982 [Enterococcus sp. 7E2_DIV0204]|uniref:polysaccharide pyruvyl transferase family protein n=1 Tax=unclassified Enterococcus TaxID=2608891 RepID=UPI000A334D0D|nr:MULTISPECIES: polysaccharide pyruvyl transferase family protein [unclassified Enterococcus]OTN89490.1 hypothetical protein A5819_001982 [Enterococcus sp. 7E2_DIV0204]OTP51944.1 hypothetical protein A5884_001139 [Enterococcus sp. 7D2_DIV0200]
MRKIKKWIVDNPDKFQLLFYYYFKVKYSRKRDLSKEELFNEIIKELKRNGAKFIVVGTPEHGNIGDAAIVYAEYMFVKKEFPKFQYIEIPEIYVPEFSEILPTMISKKDKVLFHGGGNLGSLYPAVEIVREKVVKNMIEWEIVSFPQSIYFEQTKVGKKMLKLSKKNYKNPKWSFFAREPVSFNIMKENYPDSFVELVPDIVMSLDISQEFEKKERKGVITLLRTDNEKVISGETTDQLNQVLMKFFSNSITQSDTTLEEGKTIPQKLRKKILVEKWKEIASHELAVTDRLHGMIFAFITKTPCIVFKNGNHKIESTYQHWLSKCDFIRLVDDQSISEIELMIQEVLDAKDFGFSLKGEYNPLIERINRMNQDE